MQPTEDIDQIQAPLLLQYAGLDERINSGWPAYEAKLKAHNKEYGMFLYPDVNHGFHNKTTPRYDKEAAELAWERTIAFFKEHLSWLIRFDWRFKYVLSNFNLNLKQKNPALHNFKVKFKTWNSIM